MTKLKSELSEKSKYWIPKHRYYELRHFCLQYLGVNDSHVQTVKEYIFAPMTATWFSENKKGPPSRAINTSEVIYWQMITLCIPFECQKWHLNRLLTLIRVCHEKNSPPKKMSKQELYNRNRALNAARRKSLNTRG